MQERYLGDVHDYYKFLFLKNFSKKFKTKIGLNWYLTDPKDLGPKELQLNDGEKRNYLEKGDIKIYDQNLYMEMKFLKKKENRILSKFIKRTHLKNYLGFHSSILRPDKREAWDKSSFNFYRNYNYLFLDPDNGLENKVAASKKRKIKYLLIDEINKIYKQKKNFFFCQFQPLNINHKLFLKKKVDQIYNLLDIKVELPILRNRVAPNTFFFTIAQKKNISKIENFLKDYTKIVPRTELVYL